MNHSLFAGLLLLSMIFPAAYAGEPGVDEDLVYQVKRGDTLDWLSKELLDGPARWNDVARYNRLADSNLIRPGQRLRIRPAWLKNIPAEARIESLAGAVTLNGRLAAVGDAVPAGAMLKTPSGASARLSLPDGSVMNVLETSSVSAQQLETKPRGNFFHAVFRIVTGRIEVLKRKYPEGQAPLRIQSMHTVIGVRGTHFRMAQEGNNTLAEIEEGEVAFGPENDKDHLALKGGFGAVSDGIHPPVAIPLLPPPAFPDFPPDFPPLSMSFSMPELAGATSFSGEIARDENFMQIIRQVRSQGNQISISGLAEGQYWLRLRGVDQHGLQGLQAKAAFNIKLPPLRELPVVILKAPIAEPGGQVVLGWRGDEDLRYELQVSGAKDFKLLWVTYHAQGTTLNIPPPHPVPGRYYIRARALDGQRTGPWSEAVEWKVR